MAVPSKLYKVFTAFKGLDLRTSDILRQDDAATELKNMQFRQTGAMNKRKGYQTYDQSGTGGSYGMTTFENVNVNTGVITREVISVDDNLCKLTPYSFTITYGGSNAGVYYKIYNTGGSIYFDVYDNYTRILNQDCGTGFESSGRIQISDLTTAINALTDFTCTSGTGATTNSAAFIPLTGSNTTTEITSGGTQVVYNAWADITLPENFDNPASTTPGTSSLPFYNFYAQRTSSDFENATFAQLRDVLYIATGHDELMKYDGNRVYRAGLPQGQITSVASNTTSGTAVAINTSTDYYLRYEYTDAKENIITGTLSNVSTFTAATGTNDVDVVVQYMQDGSAGITSEVGARGFNTDQATVNGAQAGVNSITVVSGNPLQVGDTVYLVDNGGSVVSRKVTASSDTSITIDGDTVTVSDTDIISCVKLQLYRTEDYTAAPGLSYLVTEIINDRDSANTTYTDTLASSSLSGNAQLVVPVKTRDEPPKCRYIDTWRSNIVMSGDKENVTTVYYSDIDSPEYFPSGDNAFNVTTKVTGIKSLDDSFFVFKDRSIDVVAGDFAQDSFQVDQISREGIGCDSHASISQVQGKLFFLSSQGVYAISSQGVEDVGAPISPKFQINNPFSFKQAVGFNWQENKQYLLFMPNLATADNASLSNDNSDEVYVYDYFRGAWLVWENFNIMGGITESNSEIYFGKRLDSDVTINKVMRTGTAADYNDHTDAIAFIFKSNWMTLQEPSVWKKFLRCKLHSYDTSINDFESDTFTLTLKTEHDYNNVKTWTNIIYDFSGGAQGWGLGPWGSFPWGDIRLSQLKKKLASKKVRSMRIILENSTRGENVLISGYELELVTPYKQMMKE